MNEQIRKRTWKYFRQQKWEEIKDFFEDIGWFFEEAWGFLCVLMVVSGAFFQLGWMETNLGEKYITLAIIGLCMIGFWVLIGIIALIKCICKWLGDNWIEAKEKALKDFKRKKK